MEPNEIKIEKGVPLKSRKRGARGVYESVANAMEVGDSVLLPTKIEANKLAAQIRSQLDRKATTRKCEGGIRVWRIA